MKFRVILEEVIFMKLKLFINFFLEGVVLRVFIKYNYFVRFVGERYRFLVGENGFNFEYE